MSTTLALTTIRLNGESRLDPGINEVSPTVAGSRGGFGLAQWTGPRRKQLEAFAADKGVPVNDPEMQLDFLMWENANTEKGAWQKVLGAQDAVQAAEFFTNHWERPGVPHLDATLATARKYAGITADPNMPQNALAGPAGMPAQQGENALAQMQAPQMQWVDMRADPSAFMNRRNSLGMG